MEKISKFTVNGRERLIADRNSLLARPWLQVMDTPSAGPHRVSRCSFLLGITTARLSLVPQVVSKERFYGRNLWRREGCERGGGTPTAWRNQGAGAPLAGGDTGRIVPADLGLGSRGFRGAMGGTRPEP